MRHPRNASGDFFVDSTCCLSCDVPTTVAPDLFAYDEDGSCFVRRQPESEKAMERMLEVFEHQDLGCIRYEGNAPEVLERIDPMFVGPRDDSPPSAPTPAAINLRGILWLVITIAGCILGAWGAIAALA